MSDFAALEAGVRTHPADPKHWIAYGLGLAQSGKADRALAAFERAASLDPRFAEAHYNCGVILFQQGDIAQARDRYEAAVAAKPDFLLALRNLGIALEALGEAKSARKVFDEAIRLYPNEPDPCWDLALLALRNGDFAEGWRCFEWRWSTGRMGQARIEPGKRLWLGGVPIAGRTLLVYEEQGLGDMIQFARFIPDVLALGAKVILQTFSPLTPLFKGQFDCEVYGVGETLPDFDLFCPMMSLPLALGYDDESRWRREPYLAAPAERREAWRKTLPRDARPRIGLVWKGNPLHEGDNARSLRLSLMTEVFGDRFDLVSLQREVTGPERTLLKRMGARDVGDDFDDFADTAAVVDSCDLVICVDTAVAHLAGALGKPLWLLLPQRSDWRWRLTGETSAWYPSARLFRGKRQSQWDDVVAAIGEALASQRHAKDWSDP